MDPVTIAAAVAGSTTALAYANAKWRLVSDLQGLYRLKKGERITAKAVSDGRINAFFLFEESANKYPDVQAIWSRERSYTYRESLEITSQFAHYFLSLGVKPGQLVAMYMTNSPEFLFVWLALLSIGCAPATINYNLNGESLIHCLKVPEAKIMIVDDYDDGCQQRIEESRSVIEGELGLTILPLRETLKLISEFPRTVPDVKYRLNTPNSFPVSLIYTSGTTGLPKGCAYTMERFYFGAHTRMGTKDTSDGVRWYNCMPLYHGTGAIVTMSMLVCGVPVAIGKKFSASNFWKEIRDSESTWFIYVGETVRYLLNNPPSSSDKDHKVVGMYGNGLRPDIWERFRERFGVQDVMEFFNSTEGMLTLLNYNRGPYTAGAVGHHGLLLRLALRKLYVPVAIDHETGDIWRDPKTGFAKRQAFEDGGEILVTIPEKAAFQGYWGNNKATDKKYALDVFKKGDIYYRSGDALRRLPDGRWYFMDRLGDTYRWKSENVATAEVSEILGQFPGLAEANVYGVLVPNHEGRAGCAAIQLSDESNFDWAEFARFARSKLPRYAVPVFLRVVKASSHIHNNKQNKVPLREEGVDPAKKGSKEPAGKDDRILWLAPGADSRYVDFGPKEWEQLVSKQARL
ncbi:putative very-long-chain acyl-CoA synthetase family protein [Talaromyces proteolyticus]|uniref:Very long-chain fatty acid transport protein n=1 Tax=Talaromyces proteolyticus TaxID=1131652 RepID=A0AAD4PWL4_9EURO|nr:putative very-long-chain acyl-CoA synthetase family protein [Talaromyces proteolyticus]KAH8695215.1 putative very-long-chain acyl-CoA synthetase family protein [Talaromyces proteolyticus]